MSSEKLNLTPQPPTPVVAQRAKSRKLATVALVAASVSLTLCAFVGPSTLDGLVGWDNGQMSRQMLVKGSCPKQVDPINVGSDWVSASSPRPKPDRRER